jgi:hypothetical protein
LLAGTDRPGNWLSDPQHAPELIGLLKEAVALHQDGRLAEARVRLVIFLIG